MIKLSSNSFKVFSNFFLLGYIFLFSLDLFGSHQTSAALIQYPAKTYLWLVLIFFLILRLKHLFSLNKKVARFVFYYLLPTTLTLTIALSLLEHLLPPNYVYNATLLHKSQLGALSLFLIITSLIHQRTNWWKKNYQKVLVFASPLMFLALLIVRTWPFDYFLVFVQEDHFIEYAQFWVLLFGSFWVAYLAFQAKKKDKIKLFWIILMLACSLFFVAAEEISWGQRLLGIETPEFVIYHNQQNEITVHNLKQVNWLVGWSYLLISWLALLSRPIALLATKINQKAHFFVDLAPKWSIFGFFVPPAIFHLVNVLGGFGIWPEWAEPMELFFYMEVVLWFGLSSHTVLLHGSQKINSS